MIEPLLVDDEPEGWQVYSPVLRAKASERKAFAALTPAVRRRIAPIIEFVPEWRGPAPSGAKGKSRSPQTPEAYVRRMLADAVSATPSGTRSFVYFGHAGPNAQWKGVDLLSAFASQVPGGSGVLPLADLSSLPTATALTRAVRHAGGNVGLRIRAGDLGPAVDGLVAHAIRPLGISRGTTHLIVDLQDAPRAISHSAVRACFHDVQSFASVVVLAGVFPFDLTQYQPGVQSELRREWEIWRSHHLATPTGRRLLGYGDYTTQCAHYRPSPSLPGSVSLRYTTDNAILVFRGRQANSGSGLGFEQIHGHCRLLVRRADYDGAAFSAGDQRIHCWTDTTKGPGNPEHWRTACLVHHITHVVVQLQDAAGSSATVRAWARAQPPSACP